MNIDSIVPEVLNTLVEKRVWLSATPDSIPRGTDGAFLPFIVWTIMGGKDAEYVDQTMGTHSNARIQLHACHPSSIEADKLIKAARDRLLASAYTVGVYGSPVGTYDAARKLYGRMQQFGIWYRE